MKLITQLVCLLGRVLSTRDASFFQRIALCALTVSALSAQPLKIGGFQLVSSKRLTRTDYEYTLRASVVNTGPAVRNVSATLNTAPAGTTIIDGALSFGEVAKGATVASTDTFVIRRTITV